MAALLPADFALLASHLKDTHFEQGVVLQEAGGRIEQVYFPHTGMISLLAVMQAGNGVETATIGREGAVHAMAGLGGRIAVARAVIQVEGRSSQISVSRFQTAVGESAGIRDLIERYTDVQMGSINQSVGCNALHHVEARFCRWLLQTRERAESDTILLTQEFLSEMLGVRRTSITEVASKIQAKGAISYSRGNIKIVDLDMLKAMSCECYETLREQAL